jgi:hypothetical protein
METNKYNSIDGIVFIFIGNSIWGDTVTGA